MVDKQFVESLKEVHIKATRMLKDIESVDDPRLKLELIIRFGNESFEKGVEYGENNKYNFT